jgi:hypothetical protein
MANSFLHNGLEPFMLKVESPIGRRCASGELLPALTAYSSAWDAWIKSIHGRATACLRHNQCATKKRLHLQVRRIVAHLTLTPRCGWHSPRER